jgi:hypothetical protein
MPSRGVENHGLHLPEKRMAQDDLGCRAAGRAPGERPASAGSPHREDGGLGLFAPQRGGAPDADRGCAQVQ